MPVLTQPDIYFGIHDPGWVVADSKQPELDYQVNSGANAGQPVETHYDSTGGVPVGSIFSRMALALRLGDFNFLISNQITSKSRVLFVRDVQQMAQKAAPFLTFDAHPYAVIANGEVQYVLDGYTTTDQYPYSENASNLNVNAGGLPGSFNYVRNSVKFVVNAYRAAFPSMFHPMSQMPESIRTHLRYPSDIFAVQAATLGKYHISTASAFFAASDRWEVSPTTGSGTPEQSLALTTVTNNAGNVVSSSLAPMSPVFQVGSLPAKNHQQLLENIAYVPAGNSSIVQGLTAFIIATSDPSDYGQLHVYVTPRGTSVTGPVQADSEIQQNSVASKDISLLDAHGSQVLLGNNVMVPLDQSVLYIRPLYVTSTSNPLPELRYVIAVFNQDVSIEPTLSQALSSVFGANFSTGPGSGPPVKTGGSTKAGQAAAVYLTNAAADFQAAKTDLDKGDLGGYQREENAAEKQVTLAQNALSHIASTTTTTIKSTKK